MLAKIVMFKVRHPWVFIFLSNLKCCHGPPGVHVMFTLDIAQGIDYHEQEKKKK